MARRRGLGSPRKPVQSFSEGGSYYPTLEDIKLVSEALRALETYRAKYRGIELKRIDVQIRQCKERLKEYELNK